MALPGMEHMAHPWAEHLSRGFMLQFSSSRSEHHLTAMDVSDPKWGPQEAASLDWAKSHKDVPGEIKMVMNYQAGGKETHGQGVAKGLAGALMHSAHHWDFGQETLPIHSHVRTEAGEHFATKTRPDLKPDAWSNLDKPGARYRTKGKASHAPVEWPNVGPEFHPFQQKKAEAERTAAANMTKPKKAKGQGTLF
jgi:hypothetical protein